MKIVELQQGSAEWYAHRNQHHNASEAPAMLGASTYVSRGELVRRVATGVDEVIDESTRRRFDEGHRAESLARPIAEAIIGEELYPCVGVDGKFSASFDGLTLLYDVGFEHKSLNADLRAAIEAANLLGAPLPEQYRIQMEHQCMVSGALRVLFMASKWDDFGNLVEEQHCWYTPDPVLRARIVAGWAQFEADVAAYTPDTASPAAVGRTPDSLPALRIEVTGMVTASNLQEFRDHAIAVFRGINTSLQNDQDFADAEKTVKWCGDIEDRLQAAKQHALSQTASIDELFRAIDAISAEARAKRLELDKLVKARKETIRGEIVERGRAAVAEHYKAINATLGKHSLTMPASLTAELTAAIKGKKTVASLTDAVDTAAAAAKIAASQHAEKVRANIAALDELSLGFESLFPDRVSLCSSKATDDLRNLVSARIGDHQTREDARNKAEAERAQRAQEVQAAPPSAAPPTRSAAPKVAPVTATVLTLHNAAFSALQFLRAKGFGNEPVTNALAAALDRDEQEAA